MTYPRLLIIIFFILTSRECLSDYGAKVMEVICDPNSDYYSIEPKIIWNDDYDTFSSSNPDGIKKDGTKITFLMEKVTSRKKRSFINTCTLKSRNITVTAQNNDYNPIIVKEDGKEIISKLPRWVWGVYGPTYSLESKSKENWSECCGHIDYGIACGLPQKKETTGCTREEVKKLQQLTH